MRVHVLGVEFGVEGCVDFQRAVVVWFEEVRPGELFSLLVALLLEGLRADQFGVWEGGVPFVHEEVMLVVRCGDVFYWTH